MNERGVTVDFLSEKSMNKELIEIKRKRRELAASDIKALLALAATKPENIKDLILLNHHSP